MSLQQFRCFRIKVSLRLIRALGFALSAERGKLACCIDLCDHFIVVFDQDMEASPLDSEDRRAVR